jgi:DNA-binding response OmpR family regulator
MRNPGKVLSRKFLMKNVWDTDFLGDTRTLDVHVRWIREKIEENPSSPVYLRTVRGVGYRFEVPEQTSGVEPGDNK